jgi:hypothetical protein
MLMALVVVVFALMTCCARASDAGVVDVTNTPGFSEGEEPLSVDPSDPRRLTVVANQWQPTFPGPLNPFPGGNGFMDTVVYSSRDGGRTWRGGRLDQGGLGRVTVPLPASTGVAPELDDALNVVTADADSAWDTHGNAYYESGDLHGVYHGGDAVASVWRSTDGGVTWQPRGGVAAVRTSEEGKELDRPWLAIDNSGGARDGTVYLMFETTPFFPTPPEVRMKRSADHGRTWSSSVRVDDGIYTTQFNPRGRPVVGADGSVYVVYDRAPITNTIAPVPQLGRISLVVARSTDGARSFRRFVVDDDVHRIRSPDEALPVYTEMIAAIAADPRRPGRVAVAWPQALNADTSRILLRSSVDGGQHWSPRVDVADDPPGGVPNQHDHVTLTWLADGRLIVGWRDRRCCGGTWTSDLQQFARTLDPDPRGGLHPGRVVTFSEGPLAPATGLRGLLMTDEFQGLASSRLGVMATWEQVVGGYGDVMFRRIALAAFDTLQLRTRCLPRRSLRVWVDSAAGEPLRTVRLRIDGLAVSLRGTRTARPVRVRRLRGHVHRVSAVAVTASTATRLRTSLRARC